MSHRNFPVFRVALPIAALAATLLLQASASVGSAAGPNRYVDSTTGADSGDCSNNLAPCLTIPYALTQASNGDTINVFAGTYGGPITVNKSVTLLGAQHGMDPRPICVPAPGTDSIINGGIFLGAANIILDGFTVENAIMFGVVTDESNGGYQIRNNVIEDNSGGGLHLNGDSSSSSTVEKNCFLGNGQWSIIGGDYSPFSGTLTDTTISDNLSQDDAFLGAFGDIESDVFVLRNVTVGGIDVSADRVTISDNTVTTPSASFGISASGLNVLISGNTVTDPPSQGIQADADDSLVITGNHVSGSDDDGIYATGNGPATVVTIDHNVVTDSGSCGCEDGIYVSNFAPVSINRNSITGSMGFGVEVISFYPADGTCNYYGTSDGPGGAGPGTGDDVSPGVTFDPWLETSDLNGPCTGSERRGVFDITSHDFGALTVGSTSPTFNLALTSNGAKTLHVTGVSIVGTNPTQFQVISNGCFNAALAPTQSCVIGVAFAPSATGGQSAVLRVTSDSGASPTDATLTGVGTGQPAKGSITIVEDSLPDATRRFLYAGDLGAFVLTDPSKRQHTFSNLTPGTYEVSQLSNPAAWSLLDISCSSAQTTDLGTATVNINLDPGANITCTFTNVFRRPDGMISLLPGGPFTGDNVYTRGSRPIQTMLRTGVAAGQTYSYFVQAQNDSLVADALTIQGISSTSLVMSVHYFVGGIDQTAAIHAGTYSTGVLAPGAFQTIEIRVTVAPGATHGRERASLRIFSAAKPYQVDTVRSITRL